MAWIAGADGCPAGWIVVLRLLAGGPAQVRLVAKIAEVFDGPEHITALALDMPIGLPDRIEGPGRAPERIVRPLLGARQSSVFSIPARVAVEAADYRESCRLALETSMPPKKVSKQGFNLFPRIREVDALLRARPDVAAVTVECHPELAFRTMKGAPLAEPKKVKSRPHPAGLAERRALLLATGLPPALVEMAPPRGAGPDDLLDAIAASWTAERVLRGQAQTYPDPYPRDRYGLPIAIWA